MRDRQGESRDIPVHQMSRTNPLGPVATWRDGRPFQAPKRPRPLDRPLLHRPEGSTGTCFCPGPAQASRYESRASCLRPWRPLPRPGITIFLTGRTGIPYSAPGKPSRLKNGGARAGTMWPGRLGTWEAAAVAARGGSASPSTPLQARPTRWIPVRTCYPCARSKGLSM